MPRVSLLLSGCTGCNCPSRFGEVGEGVPSATGPRGRPAPCRCGEPDQCQPAAVASLGRPDGPAPFREPAGSEPRGAAESGGSDRSGPAPGERPGAGDLRGCNFGGRSLRCGHRRPEAGLRAATGQHRGHYLRAHPGSCRLGSGSGAGGPRSGCPGGGQVAREVPGRWWLAVLRRRGRKALQLPDRRKGRSGRASGRHDRLPGPGYPGRCWLGVAVNRSRRMGGAGMTPTIDGWAQHPQRG